MSIDVRKPAPDPWAGWLPGDERPELPDYRTCYSPDCPQREVVQAVDPSSDECPHCGAPWGTEVVIRCANCKRDNFLTGEEADGSTRAKCNCDHCGCPFGYAGLREGSDY